MNSWRLFHLHATDLDRLVLEFVAPFLERHSDQLERRSWERHSAGGPHLRLRLKAAPEVLSSVGDCLRTEAKDYMSRRPSADLQDYSEDHARALLDKEQAIYTLDELVYRNNEVVERSYPPAQSGYESQEAAMFMEDFHHDVTPLATAILADTRPRRETVLRLFFLHAMLVTGDLKTGSVSWKSHWEGFAATFSSPELLERIRMAYDDHRDTVFKQLLEVQKLAQEEALDQDPILAGWRDLIAEYRLYARRQLAAGHAFTSQPATHEEAGEMRAAMERNLIRDSSFVRTFWSDDRFLTSLQKDLAFQVPRVLVNLFYNLVARVGLSPLDKMVLCHHVQRAVEEHFECNLQDVLKSNMAALVERQGALEADS